MPKIQIAKFNDPGHGVDGNQCYDQPPQLLQVLVANDLIDDLFLDQGRYQG
jgi:hypothetical protein